MSRLSDGGAHRGPGQGADPQHRVDRLHGRSCAWSGDCPSWPPRAARRPSSACSARSIGIIGAFQGIGRAGSASLAVVAPGIAEALIATAVGLLAAIPATIFYNYFVGELRGITAVDRALRGRLRGRPAPARGCPEQRGPPRGAGLAGRGGDPAARPAEPASLRDQRHALRGRDAGAADHLHGHGAASCSRASTSTCPRPAPSPCG